MQVQSRKLTSLGIFFPPLNLLSLYVMFVVTFLLNFFFRHLVNEFWRFDVAREGGSSQLQVMVFGDYYFNVYIYFKECLM